jgi:predicted AlkP superfamily pyrophosphatase or phosphodiesterase
MQRLGGGTIVGAAFGVAVIVAVVVTALLHAASAPAAASFAAAPSANGGRYAVVIVLDGASANELNLVPMPNLHSLTENGTVYDNAFVGQILANTPTSHATIGTGYLPRHTGVEGFLWENPQTSTVINPTETGAVLNHALENVISEHHVPTLSGQIKKAYPGGKTLSVAGHKCYASDSMGTAATDYILCALIYHNRWVAQAIPGHLPPPGAINNPKWDVPIPPRTAGFGPAVQQWKMGGENAWTMNYATWAFNRIKYPRLMMMNLSETDVLGHFAPNVGVIKTLMRQFDRLLGGLITAYKMAGIYDRTDFIITADHGMSHINQFIPYHNFTVALDNSGATAVYVEHDTAAAIGIVQNQKSQAVAQNLFHQDGTLVDATLYETETNGNYSYRVAAAKPYLTHAELNAYLTLADAEAANSGPDVVAIYPPHVSDRQFTAYGYPWRAGHLGPQWIDQHIPLIISGPGVRHGVSSYPARLVDIAPTIERLLGAPVAKTDGVVLADGLTSQTHADVAAQDARAGVLNPVITALKSRAQQ